MCYTGASLTSSYFFFSTESCFFVVDILSCADEDVQEDDEDVDVSDDPDVKVGN